MNVKQKLGQKAFDELKDQIKTKGVKIISFTKEKHVVEEDVMGNVTDVFNLGQKIDVRTNVGTAVTKGLNFRFTKIQDAYYLMQGEAH